MNRKIKTLSLIFAIILIGFTSCEDTEYSLGDLTSPSNLVITADIAGQSVDSPNGDGSGSVNFTFLADDALSYKVDFGDGSGDDVYSSSEILKQYNGVGTHNYTVIVTAIGVGGSSTTSTIDLEVYYAFDVNPVTVTLLTGDSVTGKTWAVDEDLNGHLGLGPGPNRTDGNEETFIPSWFQAAPNSRSEKGIYDDRYTFTSEGVFTHQTNGDMYGYKWAFEEDFDPAAPGVFGGFGSEWILDYPDYTEGFDYNGDDDGTEYIQFAQRGHCGFFNGAHKLMILELTETTMWLRSTSPSGTNIATWYVKLKVIE